MSLELVELWVSHEIHFIGTKSLSKLTHSERVPIIRTACLGVILLLIRQRLAA